jgi:hypothetical protein
MTIVISTATTANLSLQPFETLYVAASGSIITVNNTPTIRSTALLPAQEMAIIIDGLVASLVEPNPGAPAVIQLAVAQTPSSNTVTIGTTGILRSLGAGIVCNNSDVINNFGLIDVDGAAVALDIGGQVVNDGTIRGSFGVTAAGAEGFLRNGGNLIATNTAVDFACNNASVVNAGSISGLVNGVVLAFGRQNLTNLGDIFGRDAAVSFAAMQSGKLDNSGEVHSEGRGVAVTETTGFSMTNTGQITGGATGFQMSDSNSARILNSGSISGMTVGARVQSSDFVHLTNSGTIESGKQALVLDGNAMVVTNTGSIQSQGLDAVAATGFNFIFRNSGSIDAGSFGINYVANTTNGGTFTLTNAVTGHIEGADGGVNVQFNDDAQGGERVLIQNAGAIVGRSFGAQSSNLPFVLQNAGTITATSGTAVKVDGEQDARIVNSGVITAIPGLGLTNATAIDLRGVAGGGHGTLRNLGTILGDVQMGDQSDTVRNLGLIDGDLRLDAGADSFDGRGGLVTGQVLAGLGNDALAGGDADDYLDGGENDDLVQGRRGDDVLRGSAGNDSLLGGAGDDLIRGGVGRDVLTGDGGADVFFFANAAEVSQAPKRDLITDFTTGVDQIEFSFGPAAKTYIGAAAFSNTAGEIRFVAATGQLQGDFDGNGVADFVLILDGVAVVTATDLGL